MKLSVCVFIAVLGSCILYCSSQECMGCVCDGDVVKCRYKNAIGLFLRFVFQNRVSHHVRNLDMRTCTVSTLNETLQLALLLFPSLESLDLRYTSILCKTGMHQNVLVTTDCDVHTPPTTPIQKPPPSSTSTQKPLTTPGSRTTQYSTPFLQDRFKFNASPKTRAVKLNTTPQVKNVSDEHLNNETNSNKTANQTAVLVQKSTLASKKTLIMTTVIPPCIILWCILMCGLGTICRQKYCKDVGVVDINVEEVEENPHELFVEDMDEDERTEFDAYERKMKQRKKELGKKKKTKNEAAVITIQHEMREMKRNKRIDQRAPDPRAPTPPGSRSITPPPPFGPSSYANDLTSHSLPDPKNCAEMEEESDSAKVHNTRSGVTKDAWEDKYKISKNSKPKPKN